jgi:hypothetical protein
MPPIHISSNSIENLFKESSPIKSPGPEGIPVPVFGDLAPELAHCLRVVFCKYENEHTLARA